MPEDGLDRCADLAVQNAYWNPRPVDRSAVRALLADAYDGSAPLPSHQVPTPQRRGAARWHGHGRPRDVSDPGADQPTIENCSASTENEFSVSMNFASLSMTSRLPRRNCDSFSASSKPASQVSTTPS